MSIRLLNVSEVLLTVLVKAFIQHPFFIVNVFLFYRWYFRNVPVSRIVKSVNIGEYVSI